MCKMNAVARLSLCRYSRRLQLSCPSGHIHIRTCTCTYDIMCMQCTMYCDVPIERLRFEFNFRTCVQCAVTSDTYIVAVVPACHHTEGWCRFTPYPQQYKNNCTLHVTYMYIVVRQYTNVYKCTCIKYM